MYNIDNIYIFDNQFEKLSGNLIFMQHNMPSQVTFDDCQLPGQKQSLHCCWLSNLIQRIPLSISSKI